MRAIAVALAMSLAACAAGAVAQTLNDPTRPPSIVVESKGEQNLADSPGLQSILISQGRKIAVINGQTVTLGQKYGDSTLVAIRENEVVLKTSAGTNEVLKLYPQAEKKSAAQPRGEKSPAKKSPKVADGR